MGTMMNWRPDPNWEARMHNEHARFLKMMNLRPGDAAPPSWMTGLSRILTEDDFALMDEGEASEPLPVLNTEAHQGT
jgi:hypothetical protein